MVLPITKSARQFGYVIWTKKLNEKMKEFLREASSVHLYFMDSDLGEKRVDWKYYRISIGWRWTRRLPQEVSEFILNRKKENKLQVTCR